MLEITVHRIKGKCPVYKEGDKIIVDDPQILLDETDALCTHALSTILHYTTILERD
ncbi:MAG: TIGR04076 family protein, partial [Methanobacteriales archaeon]